ncbi:MAG TPA: hypothetical protein VFJ43_02605, partial [Bacteroidia bacterium]|nr:hypothetical protein [Bacteroidia bacterium]
MAKSTEHTIPFFGTIPADWEMTNLESITEKIGDGLHGTPSYVKESEYFFVNGNNLKEGKIVLGELTKCVSESEFIKHRKILNSDSILLSIN